MCKSFHGSRLSYILNHFRVITKLLGSTEAIVRKRRKYCRTSLTWKRESPIPFHPDRFYEPLLPGKFGFITVLFVCNSSIFTNVGFLQVVPQSFKSYSLERK